MNLSIRRSSNVFAIGFALLVLGSCSSVLKPESGAKKNPDVDFASYKTFAWISDEPMISGPVRMLDRSKDRVERAIVAALVSKGYTFIDNPEIADFTVGWTLGERKRLDTVTVPGQYHAGWRMYYGAWTSERDRRRNMVSYGWSTESVTYTQNMLSVDIFDVRLLEPSWHGYTTRELSADDRREMEPTINDAVDDIMAFFPP